jgi:hypothetical protein
MLSGQFRTTNALNHPIAIIKKESHAYQHIFCGTGGGLIWVSEWNSLQHPVASAFLATLYSNYMLTSQTAKLSCSGKSFSAADLRDFAQSQV